MPGGDGTGPVGLGPMTGRATGYCAGYGVPGYANPVFGRGFGGGWGRGGGGRGWRNRFYATGLTGWQSLAPVMPVTPFYAAGFPAAASKDQQIDALRGQAQNFENALDGIRRRIEELEGKDPVS